MTQLRNCLLLLSLVASSSFALTPPQAVFHEKSFDFGKAVRGTTITHSYAISNSGDEPLRIEQFRMTSPLRMVRVPSVIKPHSEETLEFALDTSRLKGDFEGVVLLTLNDPSTPEVELGLKGKIVERLEVSPIPALFVAVTRGEKKQAALEIINHEQGLLQIVSIEAPKEILSTQVETIEPGQHYRLIVFPNPDGPLGKHTGIITVHTSSKETPLLRIPSNIYFHDRVYTFPDAVDMGVLQMRDIRSNPRLVSRAAQTLMVYQVAGSQFTVELSTDVPSLKLSAEPGPKGDRYEITVMFDPTTVRAGTVSGSILIRTNDPQFPSLRVPVTGTIAP